MGRPEELTPRILAALVAGAATTALTGLLYECTGETCYQRVRLEHQLRRYAREHPAPAPPPAAPVLTGRKAKQLPPVIIPRLMAYKFKAAFADVSAIVHYADSTKEVTAANLTAEDADQLIAQGQGHLLEVVSDDEAAEAAAAAKPQLSTATSTLVENEAAPAVEIAPEPADGLTDAQRHDAAEAVARQSQAANQAAIDDAD